MADCRCTFTTIIFRHTAHATPAHHDFLLQLVPLLFSDCNFCIFPVQMNMCLLCIGLWFFFPYPYIALDLCSCTMMRAQIHTSGAYFIQFRWNAEMLIYHFIWNWEMIKNRRVPNQMFVHRHIIFSPLFAEKNVQHNCVLHLRFTRAFVWGCLRCTPIQVYMYIYAVAVYVVCNCLLTIACLLSRWTLRLRACQTLMMARRRETQPRSGKHRRRLLSLLTSTFQFCAMQIQKS